MQNVYKDIIICFNTICNDSNKNTDFIINICKVISVKLKILCYIASFIKKINRNKLLEDIQNYLNTLNEKDRKLFSIKLETAIKVYDEINKINKSINNSPSSFSNILNYGIMINLKYILTKLFKNELYNNSINIYYDKFINYNRVYTIKNLTINFKSLNIEQNVIDRLNTLSKFTLLSDSESLQKNLTKLNLNNPNLLNDKFNTLVGGNNVKLSLINDLNKDMISSSLMNISIPYEKQKVICEGGNEISVKLKKELNRNVKITSFITTLLFFVLSLILISILVCMVYQWFNEHIVKDENALKNNNELLNFTIPLFIHNKQNTNSKNMRKHIRTSHYI